MAKLFERKSTSLTISEFYDNYTSNKYNFDVKYQRKSGVWSEDKKSFLIDSILKNYPIPAIFLRPSVDNSSGKTVYDVVDGKQRLETIIGFIENEIALTAYFAEDDFLDEDNQKSAAEIAGMTFEEIKSQNQGFPDYIKQFWTYTLNIEYLYESNEELVATVFDRLNRNGEPLTRQELRNAKYSNSILLRTIKELAANNFWDEKLSRLKSVRMEEIEFVSELFFLVAENKILDSSPNYIDKLYEKYQNDTEQVEKTKKVFSSIVQTMNSLGIDFEKNKRICWTTHLYSLFSLIWRANQCSMIDENIGQKINEFYSQYFARNIDNTENLKKYKEAASSRTRSETQRRNRLEALVDYCHLE